MDIPFLTKQQIARLDELAVRKYTLRAGQMMENAGRNVAWWIATELKPKKVVCLYGKGNNGGDALCCARHLKIYGVDTVVVPGFEDTPNKEVVHQLTILDRMGLKPSKIDDLTLGSGDVIVDGLFGYNIDGNPQKTFAAVIEWANSQREHGAKIVSYDLPSGTHPDTGSNYNPSITADYTMTLALPKAGLQEADNVGKLFVVNIGVPHELYRKELKLETSELFKNGDVIAVS